MEGTTITKGICSGLDLAKMDSTPHVPLNSHEEWIKQTLFTMWRRKRSPTVLKPTVKGEPVKAFIDFGRWGALCECIPSKPGKPGSFEYVTPGENMFFCFNCFNEENDYFPRPVKFPSDKKRLQIEALVMDRPVNDLIGGIKISKAMNAKPLIKTPHGDLGRSWYPDETIGDLKRQNKAIKKAVE